MAPTRERILEGAMQVAIRDGIVATTLDAVAREAGISKGGLIHHFRTKDELISALLEHFPARVLRNLEARMAADPNPRGRFFRALVRTVFPSATASEVPAEPLSEMFRFLLPVLAAAANNNPELLGPLRQTLRQMRERLLAEGPNGLRQLALWPALYGLMLWQHVGVIAPDDPVCQSMIDEWLSLAEGASSTPEAPTRFPDSGHIPPQGGQGTSS
jgi:AcrR family transcriptional regulator